MSFGDLAQVTAVLFTVVGTVFGFVYARVRRLRAEVRELGLAVKGWQNVAVAAERLARATQSCIEWNSGLVDRLWAGAAEIDGRRPAMQIAKDLSTGVERCAHEVALFSPESEARTTAARQLADGIGTIRSLAAIGDACAVWPSDVELRAAHDRLARRLDAVDNRDLPG